MVRDKMKRIGVQLWSVRTDAEKDLPGTLRALAQMGYAGVELAGTYQVPPEQWSAYLKEFSLHPIAAHVGLDALSAQKRRDTFDIYRKIGCRYLVVPGLAPEFRQNRAGFERAADLINDAISDATAAGFRLGYHNHAFEFQRLPDGSLPYEVLAGRLRPEVLLEMDLGWVSFAQQDPVQWIRRYPGREVLVHVKAFSAKNETAVLGEDDVPWAQVLGACETVGGTEWYIVEHERYAAPPMVCVRQCLEYLRGLEW